MLLSAKPADIGLSAEILAMIIFAYSAFDEF